MPSFDNSQVSQIILFYNQLLYTYIVPLDDLSISGIKLLEADDLKTNACCTFKI